MPLLFITGSALLFYSTSKYFPLSLQQVFSLNRNVWRWAGAAMWIIGTLFLAQNMTVSSAIIVSLVSWITILPILIYSLTLYPKSWMGWGIFITAIAAIDLAGYAG